MARPPRWEMDDVKDGCGEVRLSKWQYFMDFVYQEMLDYETYIWRGHRNSDWTLESTLDRLIQDAKIARTKQHAFRTNHLEQFKFASRGRRGANPPNIETDNEWWALGQHHGLATPLLDWTTSPFAAAYFAFINEGDPQTRHRVIYALHKPGVEARVTKAKKQKEEANKKELDEIETGKVKSANVLTKFILEMPVTPEVEFIRPMSDENQRLVNQGGLFSKAPDGQTLEEWIQTNSVGHGGFRLMKIMIPNRDRADCLRMLNRMNVNHLTLFPDLYGASKFCNLFGKIKKY